MYLLEISGYGVNAIFIASMDVHHSSPFVITVVGSWAISSAVSGTLGFIFFVTRHRFELR